MKTLTVRLPEPLVADIEEESRGRKISKSDVVRERLEVAITIGPRLKPAVCLHLGQPAKRRSLGPTTFSDHAAALV